MQIVAVDCGRNSVKAFDGRSLLSIPSCVGEWRQRRISEGGDYEVEIDGQRFFVGELAEFESRFKREMVSRSKIHEETRVLTLTAIALLADTSKPIRLITGLPVAQYTQEVKANYTNLLAGTYMVTVNGQKRFINLSHDNISPTIEGAGAYWSEVLSGKEIKGKCRIIDMGSRTINALTINSKRFSDVDSHTLDYGCLELQNVENADEEAAEQLARRIYGDLLRRWLDMKDEPVLLSGGGALLLEPWLRQNFKNSRLINDPVFANAIGYYRMGVSKWGA